MRLHSKYGVNPTIPQCFICGKDKNEIVLMGAACRGEAPRQICLDKSPCDECQKYMKMGIIMISIRDGEGGDNPYRTGAWVVIKEEAARRLPMDDTTQADMLKHRVMFVEDRVWDHLGMPRKNIPLQEAAQCAAAWEKLEEQKRQTDKEKKDETTDPWSMESPHPPAPEGDSE